MATCRFCDRNTFSDSTMCGPCALELREWEDSVVEEVEWDIAEHTASKPPERLLKYRGKGYY